MATLQGIESEILKISGGKFQQLCDALLVKMGYVNITSLGMQAGTDKTTKGNPDTYFRTKDGKYIFVTYTTQQESIFRKIEEDINKALKDNEKLLSENKIEKIICCHTSSNLSAINVENISQKYKKYGIELELFGINEIASKIFCDYQSLAREYLGLSIDSEQVLSYEEFINIYNRNNMAAPLDTVFQYREYKKKEILDKLKVNDLVIIEGKAGVGKTRLALEIAKTFSDEEKYKLLCIRNNSLEIYDDLKAKTELKDKGESRGKYIFLVDDANEFEKLSYILEYINNSKYSIKIIFTVRNYIKEKVIIHSKQYTEPIIVEIKEFSNEEIKGFLSLNFKIENSKIINRIFKISRGNSRLAYMAGKLITDNQDLSYIYNVSDLYGAYYSKYINEVLNNDKNTLYTIGIMAIMRVVELDNIMGIEELLDFCNRSISDFKNKLYELSRKEVFDFINEKLFVFSDKIFADYMLYYIIVEKEIISLIKLLEIRYEKSDYRMIESIKTIVNLFNSKKMREKFIDKINEFENKLYKEKSKYYENFIKEFHLYFPIKSFTIVKNRINLLKTEDFNPSLIELPRNIVEKDNGLLDYMTYLNENQYLDYMIELLIKYSKKNSDAMCYSYSWLEQNYGINEREYLNKLKNPIHISKKILEKIKHGDKIATWIGIQWAKASLKFLFIRTYSEKIRSLSYYKLQINYFKELEEFRNICWEILISISNQKDFYHEIISFLDGYSNNIHHKNDIDIIKSEVKFVEKIIFKFTNFDLALLKVLDFIIFRYDELSISYNGQIKDIFNREDWELYSIVNLDTRRISNSLQKYLLDKKKLSLEYAQKISLSDIKKFVLNIKKISDMSDESSSKITDCLRFIINEFDENMMFELLRQFIDNEVLEFPCLILEKLHNNNNNNNSDKLWRIIQNIKETYIESWKFEFFYTLPKSKVNEIMMEEFLMLLKVRKERTIYPSKEKEIFDKFLSIEPNIYSLVLNIIYNRVNYEDSLKASYFEKIFWTLSKIEILNLYEKDVEIFKKIYLFMIRNGKKLDDNGEILIKLLEENETMLKEYTDLNWDEIIEVEDNHSYDIINEIMWKSDNFTKYFNYIFYNVPKNKLEFLEINSKKIFKNPDKDEIIRKHQEEWIVSFISKNTIDNFDIVRILIYILSYFDIDIRIMSIREFLNKNSNYEDFKRLQLEPTLCSGSGMSIEQERLMFWESLNKIIKGIDFLEHKEAVENMIKYIREIIKEKTLRNIIVDNIFQ